MNSSRQPIRKPRLPALALVLALLSPLAAGASATGAGAGGRPAAPGAALKARQQLAVLRARIASIAARRGAELQKRDALGADLRRAELEITAKRRALDALRAAARAAQSRLGTLIAQKAAAQAALEAERSRLAGQILAAYMIGNREQIKLLLNQVDPGRAGRMLSYYGYFGRARAAEINAIRDRMQRLASLARETAQQALHLEDLQDDAKRELAAIEAARQARNAALLAAAREVKTSDQELGSLRRQEQSVESLITDLARVMQSFPTGPQRPFAQMRGLLAWPAAGRLVAHFGELRLDSAQGSLRWNGDLLSVAKGSRIRAPYFGRVVYADWLQGLGLLMIISHGDGYLSLYGHAEVLYKSVGDRVSPGDVIAAMSDESGPPPQLYLEVRKGRRPLDPQTWFKGRP